jgi:hypothetical protein
VEANWYSTTDKDVLEAIILGTIGWKSLKEDFARKLHPANDTAGSYVVTFLVQYKDRGLTRQEWVSVLEHAKL